MKDESLLRVVARRSAVTIVERYVHDHRRLVKEIVRLVRLGLEGHLRLFEVEQRVPPAVKDQSGDKS